MIILIVIIASIVCTTIGAYFKANLDARIYWANQKNNHFAGILYRSFITLFYSALFSGLFKNAYLGVVLLSIFITCVFWIVFPLFYNKYIKQDWNFIGTTAGTDSAFSHKSTLQFTVKIGLLLLSTVSLILFL